MNVAIVALVVIACLIIRALAPAFQNRKPLKLEPHTQNTNLHK
jgi:hypothetical protein